MLYFLSQYGDGGDFFNLFRYITFRAGGAFFTALILSFMFGQPLINALKKWQKEGQPIREDGPESHVITCDMSHACLFLQGQVLADQELPVASIQELTPIDG